MATTQPQPNYRLLAYQAAIKHGIDPAIFLRQINQESGFNPNAKSSAGAAGIAQFMPGTARSYGIDPYDPVAALNAAALYDQRELAAFHGSWQEALAAYNAGAGNASEWDNPNFAHGQTYNYVRSILGGKPIATTGYSAAGGATAPAAVTPTRTAAPTVPKAPADNTAALRAILAAASAQLSTPSPTVTPNWAPLPVAQAATPAPLPTLAALAAPAQGPLAALAPSPA